MTDADQTVQRISPAARVLVTGASGFVGAHLLRALNAMDVKPVAVHQPGDTVPRDVDAEWISCDLSKESAPETLVRDLHPHYVFHLAARLSAERSWSFAAESVSVNFEATHRLMLALGSHTPELRKLLLIGSAEEYGNSPSLPVKEDSPAHPVSPYSASKAAASMFALLYADLFSLPVTILRPFILYGPGQAATMMIPQLITSALRGDNFAMTLGEQTRDFVYIEDAVDCILRAAADSGANGQIFNICSGIERSIRSVAEHIMRIMRPEMELMPGELPYRQNEVWRIVGSNEKVQRLLGWSPTTDMEAGLRKTIGWYRQNYTATT